MERSRLRRYRRLTPGRPSSSTESIFRGQFEASKGGESGRTLQGASCVSGLTILPAMSGKLDNASLSAMLNLSISKISGIMWRVETCCAGQKISAVSVHVVWERHSHGLWQHEVGRRYFMVFLVAENGGFLGFDEIARHSERVTSEDPRY